MRLVEVATGVSVNDEMIAFIKQEDTDVLVGIKHRVFEPHATYYANFDTIIESDLDYETIIKRVKGIE